MDEELEYIIQELMYDDEYLEYCDAVVQAKIILEGKRGNG